MFGEKNVDLQTILNVSEYFQFAFSFQKGVVEIKPNQSASHLVIALKNILDEFHSHIVKAELDVEPKIHTCRCV